MREYTEGRGKPYALRETQNLSAAKRYFVASALNSRVLQHMVQTHKVRNSLEPKPLDKPRADSQTHWERLDALKDDEIDTSDIPPLTEEDLARSEWRLPAEVKPIKPITK